MQKRIPVASADTYEEAASVKAGLLEGFPEATFQIRKRRNGFSIVERVTTSKAVEIQFSKQPKRRNKRGRSV